MPLLNFTNWIGFQKDVSGLLSAMEECGLVLTSVIYNGLVDRYCNVGELERAFSFLDDMVKKGIVPDVADL